MVFLPPFGLTFLHLGAPVYIRHTYSLTTNHPVVPRITLVQIFSPRASLIEHFASALEEYDAHDKVTFSILTYKLRKGVVAT